MTGLVIIPVILFLLPADYFDYGKPRICIYSQVTGQECMGCGMTRACMHFIHFDFKTAFYYNPMVYLIMPIIIFLWSFAFYNEYKFLRRAVQ